jgi:hypothetical protein
MEDTRPYKIPRPKGLEKYILENCQDINYIFFSQKEDWWECTRCGHRGKLRGSEIIPVHTPQGEERKVKTWCPNCGAEVTQKDVRYGRKKLTDRGRIIWTRGIKSVTFVNVDIFTIDYTVLPPKVRIGPDSQIRISGKSQERWDFEKWHGRTHWYCVKTINLRVKPSNMWGWSKYHDHIYHDDIRNMDVGIDLQYAEPDKFWRRVAMFDESEIARQTIRYMSDDESEIARQTIRYMSDFVKYPGIEVLEKSGFERLVMERVIDGTKTRTVNLRSKDLRKILKCDRSELRELRQEKVNAYFMENWNRWKKRAPWVRPSDVRELTKMDCCSNQGMDLIKERADISKVAKRLLEERRATDDDITFGDYADYLEAAEALGWRMDKKTVYPRNFLQMHDEAMEKYALIKDKVAVEKFAAAEKRITTMTEPWTDGRLLIRPAKSPAELGKESRVLGHCVRIYDKKVERGDAAILFIRKVEDPETPYFTLELNKYCGIVQCRGLHNCAYPDDVQKFIESWHEWLLKRIRKMVKAEKKAAKGAGAPAA